MYLHDPDGLPTRVILTCTDQIDGLTYLELPEIPGLNWFFDRCQYLKIISCEKTVTRT